MWPMTLSIPKYKETFVIVLVDKYCAILELSSPAINIIKKFNPKKLVRKTSKSSV
jgi:hypothetical protein